MSLIPHVLHWLFYITIAAAAVVWLCCSGNGGDIFIMMLANLQVNGINRHRPIFLDCIHYSNFPVFEYSHLETTNVGSQVLTVGIILSGFSYLLLISNVLLWLRVGWHAFYFLPPFTLSLVKILCVVISLYFLHAKISGVIYWHFL